jgi:dTDP-glucose 4,6-dehydratase
LKTYLVTGGAGFIGANFVKYMIKKYENISIIVLDKLTYAGNLGTIKEELSDKRVIFVKGDICNRELVENIFMNYDVDYVVNFAAESHVDRSIENPGIFLETNIIGTQTLMDSAKSHWAIGKDKGGYPIYKKGKKFLQVSTDEVYGSLERDIPEGRELKAKSEELKVVLKDRKVMPKVFGEKFFTEETALDPRSPYATSKAAADMLVRAYGETYHFPVNVTRCSNNYGPYHFPEKLIPLIIKNILEGKKLPVYGGGKQVRDWLYVEDHCKGIDMVINSGKLGEAYNIGGFNEEQNITIVKLTIDIIARLMNEEPKYHQILKTSLDNINYSLITHVQDRLGHDARYAIDPTKAVKELGFYPETPFLIGIEKTIKWYLENQEWVEEVTSGNYQKYYEKMYGRK